MEICPSPAKSTAVGLRGGLSSAGFTSRGLRTSSFSIRHVAVTCDSAPTIGKSSNRMLILGMGFVGKFFARDLKMRGGWVVNGTCTSNKKKKKKLEEMGYDIRLFDANEPDPEVLNLISHHTHLLVSIPPIAEIGDPVLQFEERLKSKLVEGNLKWLCYLSSTSVYGDCGGEWVNEDYPVSPTDEKATARLAAEKQWLKLGNDVCIPTQIFRLGGIYGPGRSAVDTVIRQEPMSESQRMRISRAYTSRVHVADICQALRASIEKPSFGKIYNVVDDDPAPRVQVFSYAWDLIEQKWPRHLNKNIATFDRLQIESSQEINSTGKKRVSNERIKGELGVRLIYPNYKTGLRSIVEEMSNPFL